MKILANDGISDSGVEELRKSGFEVITTNVAQEQLENYINTNNVVGLLVRSATTVRKDLIDKCPSLKLIGRGGVGMDNIDVDYAKSKGLDVINTPAASSHSVAELVFSHLFTCVRFLHDSNRNMPLEGDSNFKKLKKNYSKGTELKGKTLGIIGFGRIGQETAKIEEEINELENYEDRKMFLDDLGLTDSGSTILIRETHKLLNLSTFYTAGQKEVKAWTFVNGSKAPAVAGIIHSDFEKGFIRAEVIKYEDFVDYGSELKIREAGKLKVEGKDYVVEDGDIIHFRFNV